MQIIVRNGRGVYPSLMKDRILDVVECQADDVICRIGKRDVLWLKWDEVEVVVKDSNNKVLNANVKGS